MVKPKYNDYTDEGWVYLSRYQYGQLIESDEDVWDLWYSPSEHKIMLVYGDNRANRVIHQETVRCGHDSVTGEAKLRARMFGYMGGDK